MARLITKFKYLKPEDRKNVGGYAEYIATREGVEKIDESKRNAPATNKQKQPICREALANAIRTDLKLNYLPKAVTLSIGNKILHFSVSEIRYVESYNHNIIIHQSSGNSNTYYLSLTEFEKQLPKGHFSRCHNSFLVNLSRVKEIGRTDLTLRNGDMLPVGRTYYKAFQSAFIRYINQ